MVTALQRAGVVDRLLEAVKNGSGGAVADLFAADAVLDATAGGRRFHRAGRTAITAQFADWYDVTGRFEDLDRRVTAAGEVVTYLLTWERHGVPHGAHQCHVLTLAADGRIACDRFFSGGPWDAAELAAMEEADGV